MKSLFRPFPLPLTRKQWFYLGVLQGVGAGLIDGGANFGIAYAMYHNQKVVKMWVFSQNTIAGDLGVTPIIQCIASMLITSTLVHTDLHNRAISPLPFVYPHVDNLPDPRTLFQRPSGSNQGHESHQVPNEKMSQAVPSPSTSRTTENKGWTYYYWMLVRFIFEGTEKNMLLERVGIWPWLGRLLWTAAQGAGIGIVFGFPLWCLAIIILGPVYKNDNMGAKWAPEVIKMVFGAIVGWVTNPVIATLALGSQADHHLLVIQHGDGVAEEGGIPGVTTIREEDGEEVLSEGGQETNLRNRTRGNSTLFSIPIPSPESPYQSRSRSGSRSASNSPTISLRPPLTTNVSHLSPLSNPPASAPARQGSHFSTYTINRPRGESVTSHNGSVGSFSYSLGGTGGRAHRSRAGSRASIEPIHSTHANDLGNEADGGGNASGTGPLFWGPSSRQSRSGSLNTPRTEGPRNERAGSLGAMTRSGTGNSGGVSAWDIFGRRDSAPSSAIFPQTPEMGERT